MWLRQQFFLMYDYPRWWGQVCARALNSVRWQTSRSPELKNPNEKRTHIIYCIRKSAVCNGGGHVLKHRAGVPQGCGTGSHHPHNNNNNNPCYQVLYTLHTKNLFKIRLFAFRSRFEDEYGHLLSYHQDYCRRRLSDEFFMKRFRRQKNIGRVRRQYLRCLLFPQ